MNKENNQKSEILMLRAILEKMRDIDCKLFNIENDSGRTSVIIDRISEKLSWTTFFIVVILVMQAINNIIGVYYGRN